ncbi:MAG TPA: class I SAM-dependent methyltransferase [Anaerolineales bacterium]|nr:class I SAM-dependent methyltransferase [Anaerolineales bacterium]HLO34058.1 class I SAM-dependent methyltransferase [Anaerolineales bacterium]
MSWIIVVVILVVIGFILDREVYFYEAVHLGPRMQAWLYDHWSKKYDTGKRESQLRDGEMLAQPLLDTLEDVSEPFVLDFATGTGRLSQALMNQTEFRGRIIAVDLSQGMLEQAAAKLSQHLPRVELLRYLSLPLPFPDAAFDAVCALEVLELFPNMDEPMAELGRVLRPGGTLLTSRGTEESGRKAKVKSQSEFIQLLERNRFEHIQITRWWKLFDLVTAVKIGSSQSIGICNLSDVLQCSSCKHIHWTRLTDQWKCQNCGKEMPLTKEGIVLN